MRTEIFLFLRAWAICIAAPMADGISVMGASIKQAKASEAPVRTLTGSTP